MYKSSRCSFLGKGFVVAVYALASGALLVAACAQKLTDKPPDKPEIGKYSANDNEVTGIALRQVMEPTGKYTFCADFMDGVGLMRARRYWADFEIDSRLSLDLVLRNESGAVKSIKHSQCAGWAGKDAIFDEMRSHDWDISKTNFRGSKGFIYLTLPAYNANGTVALCLVAWFDGTGRSGDVLTLLAKLNGKWRLAMTVKDGRAMRY